MVKICFRFLRAKYGSLTKQLFLLCNEQVRYKQLVGLVLQQVKDVSAEVSVILLALLSQVQTGCSVMKSMFQEGIRRKCKKGVVSISEKQSFPRNPRHGFPGNLGQLSLVRTDTSYFQLQGMICNVFFKKLGNLAIFPFQPPKQGLSWKGGRKVWILGRELAIYAKYLISKIFSNILNVILHKQLSELSISYQ